MTREQTLASEQRGHSRTPRRGLKSQRQQVVLSIVAAYGRPISTSDVARLTGKTLGATAHHMRSLAGAGFLDWAGERRARGALQTFYVASEAAREALRVPRVEALFLLVGAVVTDASEGLSPVAKLDDQAIDAVIKVLDGVRPQLEAIVREFKARNG
jgi:hypothetical protein